MVSPAVEPESTQYTPENGILGEKFQKKVKSSCAVSGARNEFVKSRGSDLTGGAQSPISIFLAGLSLDAGGRFNAFFENLVKIHSF